MRWRVFGAVVFAFACSYGLLWGFGYARARICGVIDDIAEQIEVACQPRFEVARGTRVLAAGEEKRLRIENVAGRVEVVPRGPDTVAEYVIYARGEDEADARRRAAALEVRAARDSKHGDRIWVAKAKGERWPNHVSVDLVVKTPPDRELSVKVVSADVSVKGIHGHAAVDAVSGDVSVCNGAGPVVAHTVSGDICLEEVGGPVEAGTTSGDIEISAVRREQISVNSVSGDAHINALTGEHITVDSVSGDIAIEVAKPFSGCIESGSVSGDVAIALPAESDCHLQASTLSGTISGTLWPADAQRGRREMRARLGGGGGSVALSTTSGDIRLNASG